MRRFLAIGRKLAIVSRKVRTFGASLYQMVESFVLRPIGYRQEFVPGAVHSAIEGFAREYRLRDDSVDR